MPRLLSILVPHSGSSGHGILWRARKCAPELKRRCRSAPLRIRTTIRSLAEGASATIEPHPSERLQSSWLRGPLLPELSANSAASGLQDDNPSGIWRLVDGETRRGGL